MIIGVPREIKEHEYRVGITPAGVETLRGDNHTVVVEKSAGEGSGFSDEEYERAGAEIAGKEDVFRKSALIVKVKEPLPPEYESFQARQAVFTYFHLASSPDLVSFLLERRISAFAYETLEEGGELPLLVPMSEVAGRMAPMMAACYLQKIHGGMGLLMSGAGGVTPAHVVVLGAGVVGANAIKIAYGMGANVTVLNRGIEKLNKVKEAYGGKVRTVQATEENIESSVLDADVLIGAVLVAGARAPKLVSRHLISRMKKGSVIVDVSVDQGGCIETTRPTTHSDPVYSVDGVLHYTVANMPGAYPRTSTLALTNRTIHYVRGLARMGIDHAVNRDGLFKTALNTHDGRIVHEAVARAMS